MQSRMVALRARVGRLLAGGPRGLRFDPAPGQIRPGRAAVRGRRSGPSHRARRRAAEATGRAGGDGAPDADKRRGKHLSVVTKKQPPGTNARRSFGIRDGIVLPVGEVVAADYAYRAARGADPAGSNPPWPASRSSTAAQGWVERLTVDCRFNFTDLKERIFTAPRYAGSRIGGAMFLQRMGSRLGSISDAVQMEVLGGLYGTMVPIVFAAASQLVAGAIIVSQTADVVTGVLTGIGVIVALVRACDVLAFRRRFARRPALGRAEANRCRRRYAIGTGTTALLPGLFTARSLMLQDAIYSTMAIGISFGFGAGIVARLSLLPFVAIADLSVMALPPIVLAFASMDAPHFGLGMLMTIYLIGSFEMVRLSFNSTIDRIMLKQQFEQLARFDPMTGVFNRSVLAMDLPDMIADREIARSRSMRSISIISRLPTTGSAIRSAMPCSNRSPRDSRRLPGSTIASFGWEATNSFLFRGRHGRTNGLNGWRNGFSRRSVRPIASRGMTS